MKKIKLLKKSISSIVLSMVTFVSIKAMADINNELIQGTAKNATTVGDKLYSQAKNLLQIFGALGLFIGVALVGFELIVKRKDARERATTMSSLVYIGIAAILIFGTAFIVSFFINTSKATLN